jgi:nucleoid-associated protein EbfC
MQFRGGMNELVRQAARMQRKIDQVKQELKAREFTVGAASDKVKATANGERKLVRIEVDPAFVASEGFDLVCDSIVAAANGALAVAEKTVDDEIAKATGGVKPPHVG